MAGVGTEQLIFDPIRREHSGSYRCSANNGLPRPIDRLFEIDVLCKFENETKKKIELLIFEVLVRMRIKVDFIV